MAERFIKRDCGCQFDVIEADTYRVYVFACEEHKSDWEVREAVRKLEVKFDHGLKPPTVVKAP